MHSTSESDPQVAARQRWMSVLAKADGRALEEAWGKLAVRPSYQFLRAPEIGLVMVRGRTGGCGSRFNMGEMSVTRCAVQLDGGLVGISYVAGRIERHAELAAAFDALLQQPAIRPALEDFVIAPLEAAQQARRSKVSAIAAESRVEFFTMVRGED